MAFATKTDPFGIVGEAGLLECTAVTDNKSSSVAEAHDAKGTLIAHEVYGEQIAPSADYKVKKSGSIEGVKLGNVTTYDSKRVALSHIHIHTGAGEEMTLTASGEQVEDSTDGTCPAKYSVPSIPGSVCHHAQALFNAFAVGGTGCHLQTADYDFACTVGKATKDGVPIAHGVYEAYGEAQVTIIQAGSADPTLTVPQNSNWFISSPLTKTNPDADYPTWSATLRLHLAMDVEQQTGS